MWRFLSIDSNMKADRFTAKLVYREQEQHYGILFDIIVYNEPLFVIGTSHKVYKKKISLFENLSTIDKNSVCFATPRSFLYSNGPPRHK